MTRRRSRRPTLAWRWVCVGRTSRRVPPPSCCRTTASPRSALRSEEGRVIFDNIRKFVFYLFSCNLAEVLVLLGAGVVGLPQPLYPLQIFWLNLITDTFPALALAAEPAEQNVMARPPRDPQEAILSVTFFSGVAFYAALIALSTMAA